MFTRGKPPSAHPAKIHVRRVVTDFSIREEAP
jgi:hypothetical protein